MAASAKPHLPLSLSVSPNGGDKEGVVRERVKRSEDFIYRHLPVNKSCGSANSNKFDLHSPCILFQLFLIISTHINLILTTMKNKRELLKYGIQLLIAILTAIGTSIGVSSCMRML
jgi:hypothetical protein